MNREQLIEIAFLVLVFGALVYLGPAEVFRHQLIHEKPVHFGAGDGYLYAMFSNYVYDEGNFRYNPFYGSAGFNDSIAYHPPLFPHIAAAFAHTAGMHGHDALPLLMALFVLAGAFVVYWMVRGFNKYVAMLGSALYIFLYLERFIIGYVWGQALLHIGTFLVIALLYYFTKPELKHWWVPAGILLAALINAHPPEMFFFYGFIAFFLALKFIFRQLTKQEVVFWVKQVALATVLGFLLGFNFLVIFYNGYYDPGNQLQLSSPMRPEDFGAVRVPPVTDFHFLPLLAIILGGVLAVTLLRKKVHPALAATGYMFAVGFANWLGIVGLFYRAFQTRIVWPIYAAAFFGLALYAVSKRFLKSTLVVAVLALIVMGGIVHAYYTPTHSEIIYDGQWEGVKWLYDNTPERARVLFLYGDGYSQWIRMLKRLVFLIDTNDLVAMAQEGKLRRDVKIEPMLQNDMHLLYRKGFFSFGKHAKELNITVYPGIFDLCEFDYYVVDRASAYAPQLAQLNVVVANILAAHNMSMMYQNDNLVILKNNNVGGDCVA